MKALGFGRVALAVAGGVLILAPMALSAQSDDRRRAVGDWLVEDVADEVGGRVLRMEREAGDYHLLYHLSLPYEATRYQSQGFLVWRLNCGQGGEESLPGGVAGAQAAAVRARLATYLERCETPAGDAADLLRDFDRAFALLAEWGALGEVGAANMAEMEAAAEAMVDAAANTSDGYGADDMNTDMSMDVEFGETTDMNVTNSVEPD
jgi:hypothetical protein